MTKDKKEQASQANNNCQFIGDRDSFDMDRFCGRRPSKNRQGKRPEKQNEKED